MEKTNKYIVYITETLQRKVYIEASSKAEAFAKVVEKYNNEEIVLDSFDFFDVDFDAVEENIDIQNK